MAYKNIVVTPVKYSNQHTDKKSQFYKGFSTLDSTKNSVKLYDFDLIKQDLMNQLNTRKGERVMNPTFGTIIWDLLFEPLTPEVKQQISEDLNRILTSDPRSTPIQVNIEQANNGFLIELTLLMTGTDQTESMRISFDKNLGMVA